MTTEKGVLPVGIEKDGKLHRVFTVRPALVKDTVEVADEQERERLKNDNFAGLCLTAKQIVRIGDISPVPVELVMEMYDIDLTAIVEAKERLASRLVSFRAEDGREKSRLRGAAKEQTEADPCDAEDKDPVAERA